MFDDVVARAESPPSGWLTNWSVRQQYGLAIVLAGLLGLVAVQLQAKRGRRRRAVGAAQPKPRLAEMPGDDGHPPQMQIPFPDAEEQQLRATLADLVRDDPGKAAKILNRWIARGVRRGEDLMKMTEDLRKAAVLVASLDRHAADQLLEQMEPSRAEAVRSAVLMLPGVHPGEELSVIRDFLDLHQTTRERAKPLPHVRRNALLRIPPLA